MNSDKIQFLFNPQSCSGRAGAIEQTLRARIKESWPLARFVVTKPETTFWSEAPAIFSGKDYLIACGGDGTVHRAGNLAAETGAALGIVPLGSGNDFAEALGLPSDPWQALDHLQAAVIRKTDLLKIEGDLNCYCLNTTGFGLDGLASHYTESWKPYLGKAAYHSGALRAVFQSSTINAKMTIDDARPEQKRLLMLTACNGFREGGRFVVAPDAMTDDGEMDLLSVRPVNKIKILKLLPKFINSFPEPMSAFTQKRCSRLRVLFDEPVPVHVDGEYSGTYVQNISISVLPGKLGVLA